MYKDLYIYIYIYIQVARVPRLPQIRKWMVVVGGGSWWEAAPRFWVRRKLNNGDGWVVDG